jgi:D-serine deaminase-like pyridoxal phosphate-dependent protein
MSNPWYTLADEGEIATPALILHGERVERNLARMIELAGGPERLRPHVKTHKLGPLVQRQVALGITKFKCATIAEAEMCARAGAREVLLAHQPVGPQAARLAALAAAFPHVHFAATVDDLAAARQIAHAAEKAGVTLKLFLDLDVGQHRTGLPPESSAARELYAALGTWAGVRAGGLHAYDGHLSQTDVAERRRAWATAFAPVQALAAELRASGLEVPRLVAGGTPTFPFFAELPEVECTPGTCVLWDAGYGHKLPDLPFEPAATLLTRVVSKPRPGHLTLDLGHKAVASEMPHPRALFPELPHAQAVVHSEEHLVLATPEAERFHVGDALHAIPWHVCPTVALYAETLWALGGRVAERWPVTARGRRLEF